MYREVAIVVARQNGKTTLAKPLIVRWLREGKRILHVAQNRELPRSMFGMIASELEESLFLKRRGKGGKMQTIWPRHGSGQEEILLANGGSYRIAATTGMGPRGWSVDRVIVDELLAMTDHAAMMALEPTITMAPDGGQLIYLSNAGSDESVVLNAIRARAGQDDSLAYLEWSAAPERTTDDIEGWRESNPALGHYPSVLATLEAAHRKHTLAGTTNIFETEHLCRWVNTMQERLVHEAAWAALEGDVSKPTRPFMGVAMDPDGRRATAAIAWPVGDTEIHCQVLLDATGEEGPIESTSLGKDMNDRAMRMRVMKVGFDPKTDAELAKFLKNAQKIGATDFANASALFVSKVERGDVTWSNAGAVTDDLRYTARKEHTDKGTFEAVRADDDRPNTAVLAMIRAIWLASGPRFAPTRAF